MGHALEGMGCQLIQADMLGHQVIEPGGEAYAPVLQEFGTGILDPDGTINRRRLGAEVFSQPDRLEKLNQLVHPGNLRAWGKTD